MIESLQIQNLESHKDTLFKFSPGLNVFIGESDKGKSGSFRAYKWLVQNNPGGEWMRPLYWDGTTTVTGTFSNDLVVQRIRGKSENSYILNNDKPINAGTSVPEHIAKLLDLDDVNLQTQVERAFLMFETSGERGRILNRIAGLDEIETTLSNAKEDVARLDRAWKVEKATRDEKEKELNAFAPIEKMEEDVKLIDVMQNRRQTSAIKRGKLQRLGDELKTLETTITSKESLLPSLPILEELIVKTTAISMARNRILKLEKLSRSVKAIKEKEEKESFVGIESRFQFIEEKQDEADKIWARVKNLKMIVKNLRIIDQNIVDLEKELKELQAKIPNVCENCGQPLSTI